MPGPLGENEHALPVLAHLLRRALERLNRRVPVRAVDEDGPRQRHEPAQKRRFLQARFRGHGAVLREDGREQQDVERGLVVPDQDHGARGEVLGPGHNLEFHAGGVPHGVVEGAGGGPLADAMVADGAEVEGGEHAEGGAEEEGGVGGEGAGVEGGVGEEVEEGH